MLVLLSVSCEVDRSAPMKVFAVEQDVLKLVDVVEFTKLMKEVVDVVSFCVVADPPPPPAGP